MNFFLTMNADGPCVDTATEHAILDLAEKTADPQTVLRFLEDFIQNNAELLPRLALCLADPLSRQRLILTIGNSPYLANVLRHWPECLPFPGEEPLDLCSGNRQLCDDILKTNVWSEAARIVRIYKHRCFFHIGSRDLSGETPLTEVIRAISLLADGCLEAGYQWLDRQLSTRYGKPRVYAAEHPEKPARFVILGMGKLGARELNFSSDVDLIYLFEEEGGEVEGSCSLSLKGYFNRLGRDLIRFLGESTAEGQVFRIDLRLRPEGESGELALSRFSAELYYESWGQTWERSAMIKVRPVAGDLALGNEFIQGIQPFVFRRYLDYGALDAIREMKRKIDRKMALAEDYHRNIKLGYGGIREIEFFVQSLQLIHGGKNPSLRHRETLVMLDNLCKEGWLKKETAQFLTMAYQFLRTLEHRLQIKHDQQMHSIPEESAAFERLSKRMAMKDGAELRQRLTEITSAVHALYQGLFFEAEEQHKAFSHPLVEQLLVCEPGMSRCLDLLKEAGFIQPEQAVLSIQVLRDGPKRLNLTELMRSWYRRISVPLLQEILKAPNQDMALQHAEQFLTKLGHRVSFLALLLENPPILFLLVRLFGTSVLLSHYFIKHPELMDRLVAQDFLQTYRHRGELAHDLAVLLQGIDETEERFNSIRAFKNSETLRLGVRDLSKMAELSEVMTGLSNLADVILNQIFQDAMDTMERRYGRLNIPFIILAMGKLGGRELNYSSDLDLIFLHGGKDEEVWSDGNQPISHALFFARLGQRIVTSITTLTSSGKLYELDMRLRPSGNSGALVTSVDAFLHYQRTEAWTWEHQALTRSRVVVGDPMLANDLRQEIEKILRQRRDIETVRQEVVSMRLRIFAEKKPGEGWVDIKQSRGGVVDIEFLAQFLILAFSNQHSSIIQSNTGKALRACQQVGLLDSVSYDTLDESYTFFRLVENRLRLLHGHSENRIGPSPVEREQLRRLCDLPENSDIVRILMDHFQAVFPIVQRFLGDNTPLLPPANAMERI